MSKLIKPSRRTILKTSAAGIVGLAAPAIVSRAALGQVKQITVADVGGAPGQAIKAAFCDPFFEETGIEVVNVAHEPDPVTQFKLLVDTETYVWEACMVTPSHVERLKEGKNYLAPLGIDDPDGDLVDGMLTEDWLGFSVYGTILAYNTETFPDGPTSWADYLNVEKFPGRRGAYRGTAGMLDCVLLGDGVPPAELYPLDVDRAFAALERIKSDIAVWWTSGAQNTQLLQNGELDMSDSWTARAYAATTAGAPVKTVWDGLYNTDGWSVPAGSPHMDEVREFIKFCARADRQAQYVTMVANGPTNKHSFDLLPPERAQVLPTYPANLEGLTAFDSAWWTKNRQAVQQRLEEFLLL